MPALESSLLFVAFGCLLSLLLIRAPLDAWSPAAAPASPPYPHGSYSHAYSPAAPPSAPPPPAPGAMAPYQPPYSYPPAGPPSPAALVQQHPGASVSSFLVLLIATAIMGWLSWTTVWPEVAAGAAGAAGATGAPDAAGAADGAGSKEDEKQPEAAPAAKDDEADAKAPSSPTVSSAAASAGSVTSSPTSSKHSSGKGKGKGKDSHASLAQASSPSARPSTPEPEPAQTPAPDEPHTRIEALAAALPLPEVVRNVVEALSKPLKEDKPAAEAASASGGKQEGSSSESGTKKQQGGKNGKNGGGKQSKSPDSSTPETASPAPEKEEAVSEPPAAMPERSASAVAELAAQRGSATRPSTELLERATQELVAKHPELARAGAADVRDALDSIFLEAKRPASTPKPSPSSAVDPLLQAIENLRSFAGGTAQAATSDAKGVAREVKSILKKSVHFPGDRPRKQEEVAPASPPGDPAMQRIAELARRLNSS